jgi:hypothetical protein
MKNTNGEPPMKKLSSQQIIEKFIDQGRKDISLCPETIVGWKKKAKFFDHVQQDWFWSIIKNVYTQRSCHPKRGVANRAKTNLKKYGNVCSVHGKEQKKKVIETLEKKYGKGIKCAFEASEVKKQITDTIRKKYGVDNVSQSEEIKKKKIASYVERYGVVHPMHSEEVKTQIKKTNKLKFGFEYASMSAKIKDKIKASMIESYGVESPFQLPGVRQKSYKTNLEKYGAKTFWESKKVYLEDTGQSLVDWYRELQLSENKSRIPSYGHIITTIREVNKEKFTRNTLQKLVDNYANNKTSLEVMAEQLFLTPKFNRKPENIPKLYRPDFMLSPALYVNVDGLYWHSDAVQEDKMYHFNMRKHFEENDARIIQFREDEVRDKSHIVSSIVSNSIGKTAIKLHARKCNCGTTDPKSASLFLERNHLMGKTNAKHAGLYCMSSGNLVCLMSYKINKSTSVLKIERFCSVVDAFVNGGFSKLLSFVIKSNDLTNIKEIHNWVDLRYGTGNHLLEKGFFIARETLGWKWTDGIKSFNRLKCRANMDNRGLPEKRHAEELGWSRLYDAGQRLYVKTL